MWLAPSIGNPGSATGGCVRVFILERCPCGKKWLLNVGKWDLLKCSTLSSISLAAAAAMG